MAFQWMAPQYWQGLRRGTVGGQKGWLDPRVDFPKLIPEFGPGDVEEERKTHGAISNFLKEEAHKKRWFVNQEKFKPDLTPIPGSAPVPPSVRRERMRETSRAYQKEKNWEKGWSLLNQDDIGDLMGAPTIEYEKGKHKLDLRNIPERITNKEAERLMQANVEQLPYASQAKLREDGQAVEGSVANPKEKDTSVKESQEKVGVKSNNELVAEDQQLKGQGGRDLGATTRRNTANDVDTKPTIEKTESQTPNTPPPPVTQQKAESTMKISEMAGKAHTVLANLANIASILDTGTGPGATLHKRPSKTNTKTPKGEQQSSEGKTWDPDKQMWV